MAKDELGTTDSQQIRFADQPMIHGIWSSFPRDEAGANLLTDGRQKRDVIFVEWR